MEWFEALVLGIIQGLTEFLPVSSSGHLQIFSALFGLEGEENLVSAECRAMTEVQCVHEACDALFSFFLKHI